MTFVLTPEQRAAVEHPLAPLLVVAGAGTGKTSVMAERMLHVVRAGLARPDQLLGLTFTNKAAANLKRAVLPRLGPDADVTVSTYHAFGAGLVAGHPLELGLDPSARVLNRAQAWQLLFSVFDEFRFVRRGTFLPSIVVDDALALASHCADHLVPIEAVVADCNDVKAHGKWKRQRETAEKRLELCQVVAAYDRRKRERNLIDYGDQVALAVRLVREQPHLAAGLRDQHPVVLLDEYQDTNYAQRVLLQLIYPAGSAVTAVGDDMQSIYAFRGAHLGNILGFEDHFPPVTRRPLVTNRRSGPQVVALANRIQGRVGRTIPKELTALSSAPRSRIECFLASDDAEEAAEIARDVHERGSPWSGDAVLCRKRSLIPSVARALEELGVPVDVVGASGLLDRPEIVDLVSWLEVLADLSASVALVRILQGPRYRIGWRDLAALARHARALSKEDEEPEVPFDLADSLADLDGVEGLSHEAGHRLRSFCADRHALSAAAARLSVLDLAEAVVERTGLWAAAGPLGRENLLRFTDLASRFAPVEGDPGLPAFVEYLHLLDETDEDLAEAHLTDRDAVRVMTIHQAKGLEFERVWVPGLAGGAGRGSGIFPDTRPAENPLGQASALPWWARPDDEDMPPWRTAASERELTDEIKRRKDDEEWRLLYVACTRAMRLLVCSAAHWYPGPADPQGPSLFYRFIAEQHDLVTERFAHGPSRTDPARAAKERRWADVAHRYAAVVPEPPGTVGQRRLLDDSDLAPVALGPARVAPTALSVTSLVSYARCPRQFFWSVVRPLPRRPSAARRLGTEVHRWIEERAGRQLVLVEPEPGPGAGAGDDEGPMAHDGAAPSLTARLRASFLASPYAPLDPERVEAPFQLAVEGRLVRGRVDAVYRRDGRLELVDFKTGRAPAEGDRGAATQLDLYALAAVDTWRAAPDEVRTTYCYLGEGEPALVSRDRHPDELAGVRKELGSALTAIEQRRYEATAGAWCCRCDFLPFCSPGQCATDA